MEAQRNESRTKFKFKGSKGSNKLVEKFDARLPPSNGDDAFVKSFVRTGYSTATAKHNQTSGAR